MRPRLAVLGLVVPLLAIAMGGAAHADATTTSFTATITVVQTGAPQRQWVDDGILHVRHQRFSDDVSGDLSGTQVSIGSIDLNLATGEGTGRARLELATDRGSWSGHLSGQIQNFAFSGHLEGEGTGDSKGTRIQGVFWQTGNNPETFIVKGRILDTGDD